MIHSEEEGEVQEQNLDGLINILKPRSTLFLNPSPSSSSSCCEIIDNSPRSLQMMTNTCTPPGKWNVRNNYLAFEDILMERMRTTIPYDYSSDHPPEASDGVVTIADYVYCYDSQDEEDKTVEGKAEASGVVSPDCSTSSSFVCEECLNKEVAEELEKVTDNSTTVAAAITGFRGTKWTNIGLMLLCVIVAVVVGLILSRRKGHCSDGCSSLFLVPT